MALDCITHDTDHHICDIAVERGGVKANDGVPPSLQRSVTPRIFRRNTVVPVRFINLNADAEVRQVEVNRELTNLIFLHERHAEMLQAQSHGTFGRGFSGVLAIARERAEAACRPSVARVQVCRDASKGLAAFLTRQDNWRPIARFRAVHTPMATAKDLPTTLAFNIPVALDHFIAAFRRAIWLVLGGGIDVERLIANRARLGDLQAFVLAPLRTELRVLRATALHAPLPAVLAVDPRTRLNTGNLPLRELALVLKAAGIRTEVPDCSSQVARGTLERLAAFITNSVGFGRIGVHVNLIRSCAVPRAVSAAPGLSRVSSIPDSRAVMGFSARSDA